MKKNTYLLFLWTILPVILLHVSCAPETPHTRMSLEGALLRASSSAVPRGSEKNDTLPSLQPATSPEPVQTFVGIPDPCSPGEYHFTLPQNIAPGSTFTLSYEVRGVSAVSLARRINDAPACGGYIRQLRADWNSGKSTLPAHLFYRGSNTVCFRMRGENDSLSYELRNVQLHIRSAAGQDHKRLLVNQSATQSYYGPYGYVEGYAYDRSGPADSVTIDGRTLPLYGDRFQTFVPRNLFSTSDGDRWTAALTAYYRDGRTLSETLTFTKPEPYQILHPLSEAPLYREQRADPQESFAMTLCGLTLESDSGTLHAPVAFRASTLEKIDMALLPLEMDNLTEGAYGYRLLPHGEHFRTPARIRIAYDTAALPLGYTPHDIYTYYYDETTRKWTPLQRDSVDLERREIVSLTTHFTDFINGILKTPEMPETQAFVPTMMTDLQAANPLEGLQLIQPPTANNNGTANISYPLTLPAGRNGMQPQLALQYNSSGGNGFLGVGWDIPIPAITVETRWGVPRYNPAKESEVYLLNGEQLVTKDGQGKFREMPHRTNLWQNRMAGDILFYPRVDETFDSIIRHGTHPADYWWEVVDRNGVSHYYGKQKNSAAPDPGSTLRDPSGNIAHWALTESRDPYGNTVRYYYNKVLHPGVSGGSPGQQLYPSYITYSGNGNTDGKYSIRFGRSGDRDDAGVSGRYGFKEVTADLLRNISVTYNNDTLIFYLIHYENSYESQYKNRICGVLQVDDKELRRFMDFYTGEVLPPGGKDLCDMLRSENFDYGARYSFDYYDAPAANALFGEAVTIQTNANDDITSDFITGKFYNNGRGNATALGATQGKSWSVGGTLGIGGGPVVVFTSASAGGNYDRSGSQSEGLLTMIDLNGDGLPDKVFKQNGQLYCRHQIRNAAGAVSFSSKYPLNGASDFLVENSRTNTWGLQASVFVRGAAGWSNTESYTSVYFADVNGDGFPDLVTDRGVRFNKSANGIIGFGDLVDYKDAEVSIPTTVCGSTLFDGTVDPDIVCPVSCETLKFSRLGWTEKRVCDTVWNQTQRGRQCYVNDTHIYVYIPIRNCSGSGTVLTEPELETVKLWIAPVSGNVSIASSIQLANTGDAGRNQSRYANGIRYTIQHETGVGISGNGLQSSGRTLVASNVIGEGDYEVKTTAYTRWVNAGDILFFRLQSDGNRSYDHADWRQTITYTNLNSTADAFGRPQNRYDSQEDYLVSGYTYFQAPAAGTVSLSGTLSSGTLSSPAKLALIRVVNQTPITLYTWDITSNMSPTAISFPNLPVTANDEIRISVTSSNLPNTTWSNIYFAPRIVYTGTLDNKVRTQTVYPPVCVNIINEYSPSILNPKQLYRYLFGPLYRGWGQFVYNSEGRPSTAVLDVSALHYPVTVNTNGSASTDDTLGISSIHISSHNAAVVDAEFSSHNGYNPLSVSSRWIELQPDMTRRAWRGYGDLCYITFTRMGNTTVREWVTEAGTAAIAEYDHPVPVGVTNGAVAKTIRKKTVSSNNSLSAGLSMGVYSLGASNSDGSNTVTTEYMDLNGDRYPDFVSENSVQYSQPWGGIGNMTVFPPHINGSSHSSTTNTGQNLGRSFQAPSRLPSMNPRLAKIISSGSGSVSGSIGSGNDATESTWLDINADGLPDKVFNNGYAALNMGYYFLPYEAWNYDAVRTGVSSNNGLGLGSNYSMESASIGGGVDISSSENTTGYMLIDINGDGLPDQVRRNNNELKVYFNLGKGRWSAAHSIALPYISYGTSYSEGINAAVTFGFTFMGIIKVTAGVQGSPYSRSFSKDNVQLVDMDGDGYPDYVTSGNESTLEVRYNQMGKANLLKGVRNFTRSTMEVDYEQPPSTVWHTQRPWVMKSLTVKNPHSPLGGCTQYRTFRYGGAYYDRYERMAYGFDTVCTYEHNPENNNALYRYTVETYHNRSYIKRGKKKNEKLFDGQHRPYIETVYDVQLADLNNGQWVGEEDCPTEVFPLLKAEIKNYYEGQTSPQLTTMECYAYDRYRNVIRYLNRADTLYTDDDTEVTLTYKKGMPRHFIALLDTVKVYTYNKAKLLRMSTRSYNTQGKLAQEKQHNGNQVPVYDLTYDHTYGNVTQLKLPANHKGQRMYHNYTYETVLHTYPVSVTNAFNETSSAIYDYRWGKPLTVTDRTGNQTQYVYDTWGRITQIKGPKEIASGAPYTVRIQYRYVKADMNRFMGGNVIPSYDTFSYARTYHYDPNYPNNPMQTTVLCDGWGRVVQTKKDIELNGNEMMCVSGKIVYDAFGRVVAQYHPVAEALGRDSLCQHACAVAAVTRSTYDILDRPLQVTLPDGTMTQTAYHVGADLYGKRKFRTTLTDALGRATITYANALNLQTQQTDAAGGHTQWVFDGLGQLVESSNPEGISTYYEYDRLGRPVTRVHPDAGITKYTYDAAGNLTKKKTQALDNMGVSLQYSYHYNRPDSIVYPLIPQNNVQYQYGTSGNQKGRVVKITDGSGWQEFSYGNMGEVIQNVRTFALPNDNNVYTFAMNFAYDSWNRAQSITYPDGEAVTYKYDKGGKLTKVTALKGSESFVYVTGIRYNLFGSRTYIQYGNGTQTYYSYDILQRLDSLRSYTATGVPMQVLAYTYDSVSNIVRLQNTAPATAGMGGRYTYTYGYDVLDRLTRARGRFNTLNYQLDMAYSPAGKTALKIQPGTQQNSIYGYCNSSQPHAVRCVYDQSTAEYTRIWWDANGNMAQTASYGNTDKLNAFRKLFWNEEDRLTTVIDNDYFSYYGYDASGERFLKMTGSSYFMDINAEEIMAGVNIQQMTLYASPYLVATPRGYTKHYYAGDQRIASKSGKGGLNHNGYLLMTSPPLHSRYAELLDNTLSKITDMEYARMESYGNENSTIKTPDETTVLPTGDMLPGRILSVILEDRSDHSMQTLNVYATVKGPESAVWYYHSDHLGSASWITDAGGIPIQYLQYLPFGEPFVDQRMTNYSERFTFTGKERDEETGYYNFGARYLDPLGLTGWLSVDPLSDKYPSTSPYMYCLGNPIRLVDPNGMDVEPTTEAAKAEIEKYTNPKSKDYQPEFAKLYNEWKDNKNIMVKFEAGEDYTSTVGYSGVNENNQDVYNVSWDHTIAQYLGTSAVFEEAFHLEQGFKGEENGGFDIKTNTGMSLDLEVDAKINVVTKIKNIKNTREDDNQCIQKTHYGYVKNYANKPSQIKKALLGNGNGSPYRVQDGTGCTYPLYGTGGSYYRMYGK